jgi:hypothetical protein
MCFVLVCSLFASPLSKEKTRVIPVSGSVSSSKEVKNSINSISETDTIIVHSNEWELVGSLSLNLYGGSSYIISAFCDIDDRTEEGLPKRFYFVLSGVMKSSPSVQSLYMTGAFIKRAESVLN